MTTTRFAIAAVATALMGSTALAADLGGNCCADLEERIAELEATTVRKGNRKVSLTLSGYVSHHVMYWNDGTQNDVYIGDGGGYGSRFRFVGEAKINPQLTAGFLYEFQANTSSIGSMNQLNGGSAISGAGGAGGNTIIGYAGCGASGGVTNSSIQATNSPGCPVIRDTTVWLRHSQLGMIKVGHGSTATDNLILIDLGGASGGSASSPDVGLFAGGFLLRGKNGQLAGSTGLTWGNAIRGHESFDTFRREHVLYETPTLMGFSLQAAIASDNFWDVALRYAGEFNGVRIAAGVGYSEDTNFNSASQLLANTAGTGTTNPALGALCQSTNILAAGSIPASTINGNCTVKSQDWKASASALHVPTGAYLTAAYGNRKLSGGSNPNNEGGTQYTGPDLNLLYLNAGISKNFFGMGNTIPFLEWSQSTGGLAQIAFLNGVNGNAGASGFCTVLSGVGTAAGQSCKSNVTTWGLGIQQNIDAASMQVFLTYRNMSLETNGFTGTNASLNGFNGGVHDVQTVILGTKIDF